MEKLLRARDRSKDSKSALETLMSKTKAFRYCLELAVDHLKNKDLGNAQIIYASILGDISASSGAFNLNELHIFSLHCCFAYACTGSDISESPLGILNSMDNSIRLPLVPYLKAHVHLANNRVSFAEDQLDICTEMISTGYNFQINEYLNEEIIPEINLKFLNMKINGLRFACMMFKTKKDNVSVTNYISSQWMRLGEICPIDITRSAKKTENAPKERKEIGLQTIRAKMTNAFVQTTERDNNKQVLTAIADIKNKMNNIYQKKDLDLKVLQQKHLEFTEKMVSNDSKQQQLKAKNALLEKKLEESQKEAVFLKKLIIEQLQQKRQMQQFCYQMLEDRSNQKIDYLGDIQKHLKTHSDEFSLEDCKQEMQLWGNTLNRVTTARADFNTYFNGIDQMLFGENYTLIKTNDWPQIPSFPSDVNDVIYKAFKKIVQRTDSHTPTIPFYPMTSPKVHRYPNNVNPAPFYPTNQPIHNENSGNPMGAVPRRFPPRNNCLQGHSHVDFPIPRLMVPPPRQYCQGPPPAQTQDQSTTNYPPHDRKRNEAPFYSVPPPIELPPQYTAGTIGHESEKELHAYLQTVLNDCDELAVFQEITKILDLNGGSLIGLNKEKIAADIKRNIKQEQTTKKNDDNSCCICFEDMNHGTYSLRCHHEFHRKCIESWLNVQSACPVCRTPVMRQS